MNLLPKRVTDRVLKYLIHLLGITWLDDRTSCLFIKRLRNHFLIEPYIAGILLRPPYQGIAAVTCRPLISRLVPISTTVHIAITLTVTFSFDAVSWARDEHVVCAGRPRRQHYYTLCQHLFFSKRTWRIGDLQSARWVVYLFTHLSTKHINIFTLNPQWMSVLSSASTS